MEDQLSFVASRLELLRSQAEVWLRHTLRKRHGYEMDTSHQLALWLFLFHESSGVLVHSELLHPEWKKDNDKNDKIVKRSHILGGQGTVGFVLHTAAAEAVADTFDDPRGTVAVQDTLLRNYSWCGVSIQNAAKKPIGVVSFFPVALNSELSATWPEKFTRDVQRCLEKFVGNKSRHEQFSLLCHLALARKANSLLTEAFKADAASPLQSKVAAMLGRILMLGAPFGKLPAVLFLEKRTLREARRQEREYVCRTPSFFRFNAAQLRLERLQHLQWEALARPVESVINMASFDSEEVETIPLAFRENDMDPGLLLVVHFRQGCAAARTVIDRLCEPWRELFKSIYKNYYLVPTSDPDKLKRRKILSEAAALLFSEFSRLVLVENIAVGIQDAKQPGRDKTSLQSLRSFLLKEYIPDTGFEDIFRFLRTFDQLDEDFELLRKQVLGLSLWHRVSEWLITGYEGFNEPSELKKLMASGNWRVLQRAAALGTRRPLEQYKPIDWHAVKNWTVTKKDDLKECTISWPGHIVTFSESNSFFPLDLQLCDQGLAEHFFDHQTSALTFLYEDKDGDLQHRLLYSGDDKRLDRYHEIIASEGMHIIAAGPLMAVSDTTLEIDAQSTLREFAQKELQVLLLSEYARQVTKASHKAGITAIMARNASHNLGSHVLARHSMREIVRATATKAEDPVRLECEIKDTQLLDRYLQGRMDLLAQISTDWPEWTEPARLVGEILWGFLTQKIMLQEIVASEGIGALEWEEDEEGGWLGRSSGRKGGIRFNCLLVPRGEAWDAPTGFEARGGEELLLMKPRRHQEGKYQLKMGLKNDPLIAIPGGLAGWHAFYIIVENLIRNSAKHGKSSKNDGLGFVIEILDDRGSQVYIRDRREERELLRPAYLVRVYDDMKVVEDELLNKINSALRDSVIDEGDGHLRRENWGLAEMKVAAAYLQRRGLDSLGILSRSGTPESEIERTTGNLAEPLSGGTQGHAVIRAIRSPIGTLGYEFFLLKPTRLAVARL